jgi:hypothetical protein
MFTGQISNRRTCNVDSNRFRVVRVVVLMDQDRIDETIGPVLASTAANSFEGFLVFRFSDRL